MTDPEAEKEQPEPEVAVLCVLLNPPPVARDEEQIRIELEVPNDRWYEVRNAVRSLLERGMIEYVGGSTFTPFRATSKGEDAWHKSRRAGSRPKASYDERRKLSFKWFEG